MKKNKINIIDLFCGCGGLSYGFQMAGCNVLLGIDNWKDSLKTFKCNHKDSEIFYGDIEKMNKKNILDIIGNKKIDVIVGGPPCQTSSLNLHNSF